MKSVRFKKNNYRKLIFQQKMIKRTLTILSISAAYFVQAQNISTIQNTVDVYSGSASNGSSKYMGMAGSMGALGGDFSTLNSNPAGIGVSIANDLSATLNIESNKSTSTYAGSSINYKINNTDLGNVGGVMVFRTGETSKWKFVNVGVNYSNRSIENYVETPGNNNLIYDITDNDGNIIDNLTFKGHAYNRYGNVSKMSIGVGGNYDNRIYAGIGINVHSTNLDQYDTAAFGSSKYSTIDIYDKQDTPFSESSSGFSASVGVIGKVNQNFRLGAAIETPTWWSVSRAYNFYEDPYYGDGVGNEDRKLSTPMKAILSAAFVANKDFSINVDYSLGLTKPKYKVYGDAETELNNFFSDNYKSLSEVKVGAEYRIADFRLRGGYGFASNPFDSLSISTITDSGNANRSYDNLFLGKRNTLAFGLGYDFKTFYIDAAYQNITSEYSNPFMQGSSAYNSGYFSPDYIVESDAFIVSDVKNTRNNFFITLGWKF